MADDPAISPTSWTEDGLTIHHFPSADAVCAAELIFAVGSRDETLPTAGALHALEHLVMRTVRDLPIQMNACVTDTDTTFTATGTPERVGQFLTRVCTALGDPPVHDLAHEAKILAAEDEESGSGWGPLTTARHGRTGLAVAGGPGPGPEGITPAMVQAATAWFTADNAFLVLDGARPAALDLPLRRGPAPVRGRESVRSWDSPHALLVEGPACVASLLVPPPSRDGLALVIAAALEFRVAESLRHVGGFAYHVDVDVTPLRDGRSELLVYAEPPEERAVAAVEAMVRALLDLVRNGPSPQEVERARHQVIERITGRGAAIVSATLASLSERTGRTWVAPEPQAVGGADLHAGLAGCADDILFMVDERATNVLRALSVPETADEPLADQPPPGGRVFVPPLLMRAISGEARRARVHLFDWGLAGVYADGVGSIAWPDVVGVMTTEDEITVVFGADGTSVSIGARLYKGGQDLVDAVRRHVPEALHFREAADPTDRGGRLDG